MHMMALMAELWIQQVVREERITLQKIKGSFNTADMFTKHLDRAKTDQCMEYLDECEESGVIWPDPTEGPVSTEESRPRGKN